MTQRTILHLVHTSGSGGAETVMWNLIDRLDPRRWRSVAGVPEGSWIGSALCGGQAEVVTLPYSGAFNFRLMHRIAALTLERSVDLIHTHLFGPALYASLVARMLRRPVVATIHGSIDLSTVDRWWGMKQLAIDRPENRFVAVTERLRREAVQRLHLRSSSCRLIRNGVDVDRFTPSRDRRLREELGWGSDQLVVGALGNVRHPKDYANLLQATRLVLDEIPSLRVVIIGDTTGEPALYQDLLERRRSLDLDDIVTFTGFRVDVVSALNALDVFVMSSMKEGLPLAVLQAMAVRLPIVATRCGGPDEILCHGENAWLVPVREPRALADGILRLARDPEERLRLARAGYEAAHSRFSLGRVTREYEDLYVESLETLRRDSS